MKPGIAASLGTLKALKGGRPDIQTLRRPDVQTATAAVPVPGMAKSKRLDFEKTTLYLDGGNKKKAARRFEDEAGGDLSDLVNKLLAEWLNG